MGCPLHPPELSGEREPWNDAFVDALCTRDGQTLSGETAVSATWEPEPENCAMLATFPLLQGLQGFLMVERVPFY